MKKRESDGNYGIFDAGTGFYYYTGKVCDLLAAGLFCLLGCLPVITAGASFAALYCAVSESVRRDIGTVSRKFWHSFKRNLRDSLPLLLIYGGGIFLLLLNFGIVRSEMKGLPGLFFQMLYLFAALLLIAAAHYGFASLSRFDMPVRWILKLSFYLTFRHLPRTLLILVLFAAAYFLTLYSLVFILVLPGFYALLASFLMDPALDAHMPGEEGEKKGERDREK